MTALVRALHWFIAPPHPKEPSVAALAGGAAAPTRTGRAASALADAPTPSSGTSTRLADPLTVGGATAVDLADVPTPTPGGPVATLADPPTAGGGTAVDLADVPAPPPGGPVVTLTDPPTAGGGTASPGDAASDFADVAAVRGGSVPSVPGRPATFAASPTAVLAGSKSALPGASMARAGECDSALDALSTGRSGRAPGRVLPTAAHHERTEPSAGRTSWRPEPPAIPGDDRALGPEQRVASAPLEITSAAVLGRPREVGPVAAGVALALRRETRARVATVVVVGEPARELSGGGSGGPAGRRIAARLEAFGLEPVIRGRLVWVALEPARPDVAARILEVTLIAAPVVIAVMAPRTAALDEALAEQDLLVLVTSEPDGPLARIASVGLPPMSVFPVPPLARGPARALARTGVRAPTAVRKLVSPTRDDRR